MPEDFITPVHPLPGSEPEIILPSGHENSQQFSQNKVAPTLASLGRGVNEVASLRLGLSETPRELSQSQEFRVLPEIDNTNRHFKGQQKNESVYCFCRKHWIILLPHFIGAPIAIGIFLAFIASASFWNPVTYRIIAGLLILGLTYYFHYFFNRFFNYYLQIFIVTNFRVIQLEQTLYFHRNRDSIDLPEIQDIVIQQNGIIKTLLNYGEIIITLSSAHASKTLQCVPNPEYYFRKINKTKREYITVRRVEKGKPPVQE